MAINSSSNPRFQKPHFLKNELEKVEPRIEKFLNVCGLENLLISDQQKITYAKLLMGKRGNVIPQDCLTHEYGMDNATKLLNALAHVTNKFKTEKGREHFMEALEWHLVKQVLGEEKGCRFYLELNMSDKFCLVENRQRALDEEFQVIRAPTLQNRISPLETRSGEDKEARLSSTPPVILVPKSTPSRGQSLISSAPRKTEESGDGSRNAGNANSTSGSQQE